MTDYLPSAHTAKGDYSHGISALRCTHSTIFGCIALIVAESRQLTFLVFSRPCEFQFIAVTSTTARADYFVWAPPEPCVILLFLSIDLSILRAMEVEVSPSHLVIC